MRSKRLSFARIVVEWGKTNRRDFIWRRTRNPYQILIAELLVQRTRAAQAEFTYQEFLERWPDIISLSRATAEEVRAVIRRLGLDYRVRRLRQLAKEIVRLFGSTIPDNLADLRHLYGKGFGDYMAHAILCFAYFRDVPVVDKNVERILTRVFSIKTRTDGHRDPKLWQFAGELVPSGKAREYNWSLIDFGALVCTPKNPLCPACPLLKICDFGRQRVGMLRTT